MAFFFSIKKGEFFTSYFTYSLALLFIQILRHFSDTSLCKIMSCCIVSGQKHYFSPSVLSSLYFGNRLVIFCVYTYFLMENPGLCFGMMIFHTDVRNPDSLIDFILKIRDLCICNISFIGENAQRNVESSCKSGVV